MSIYALFIWTVVGVGGTAHSMFSESDWRAMGEFRGEQTCIEAARQLNIVPGKYRCINTGRTTGEKK